MVVRKQIILSEELNEMLQKYAQETDSNESRIIRKALTDLFSKKETKEEQTKMEQTLTEVLSKKEIQKMILDEMLKRM